jgi:hypothetical protein
MSNSSEALSFREEADGLLSLIYSLSNLAPEKIISFDFLADIISRLENILSKLDMVERAHPQTESAGKVVPANILSIAQLRGIYSAVEIIWMWGLLQVWIQ